MPNIILFGTEACHLCEEAKQLLDSFAKEYQCLEILDKQEWQEEYGLKIPVLLHTESLQQLNWPFDFEQLQKFFEQSNP